MKSRTYFQSRTNFKKDTFKTIAFKKPPNIQFMIKIGFFVHKSSNRWGKAWSFFLTWTKWFDIYFGRNESYFSIGEMTQISSFISGLTVKLINNANFWCLLVLSLLRIFKAGWIHTVQYRLETKFEMKIFDRIIQ